MFYLVIRYFARIVPSPMPAQTPFYPWYRRAPEATHLVWALSLPGILASSDQRLFLPRQGSSKPK